MVEMPKVLTSLLIILSFFATLFLYTKFAGPLPFSVTNTTLDKTDTFTVTGEGTTFVKPDIANVAVGIESTGATVSQTQNQANQVMNSIVAALKNLGVDTNKDVKTTDYRVNPTYDYTGGRQRITGYTTSTNINIKVRDIDKVNQVIDVATANGANQVGGISFDVDDKTKAEEQARKEAVSEAKQKAQQAASIAGFRLGKIINYSENNEIPPRPLMYGMGAAKNDSAVPPTQIQTGSSEIKITVSLSYQIY